MSRPIRTLLAPLAVAALLGACGGGDDDSSAGPTTTESAEETTTTDPEVDETTTTVAASEVCALIDPADLEDVTGLPFEDQEGDATSCTYLSSTGAAIALNVADVTQAPDAGYQGAQGTCEDGTVEEITIAEADAAFTCIVTGIPTVAAIGGEGFLVILTGDDADETVDDATITDALVTILEDAIANA